MSTRGADRYHSLDALRASMMLLGLVLHSAVSYIHEPIPQAWPYKDPDTSPAFDLLVFFIHLFRMPVFFVAAGFFAALLTERDGPRGFFFNRLKRLLLPLAIFWPLVYPLIAAGFIYANTRAAGRVDMTPLTSGAFLQVANLAHLWFLWYLLIFCAVAAAVSGVRFRLALPAAPPPALAMGMITALTLLPMTVPGLDTAVTLVPPIRVLVAYGVFFAFGWLLFRRRDQLDRLGARWKRHMMLGGALSLAYVVLLVGRLIPDPTLIHFVACALAGVATWMLIYGIIGLFLDKLSQPRPLFRYLSDASYWMYIVHLPLTIAVPGLLAPWTAPAPIKFAVTLTVVTAVTVTTYHYFVRSTAIGVLLSGRRYPRALAPREATREAVTI